MFSDIEKKGCSAEDLLLEIDRILRPTGFVIIRDRSAMVNVVKKYLLALHWEAVATADAGPDSEGDEEVVFIVQKKMWLTNGRFSESE